jgi:hypothetical protein
MKKLKSIQLTSFLYSGKIQGSLGDVIEVTAENEADCKSLLTEKGAKVHEFAGADEPPTVAGGEGSEGSEDDGEEGDDENALVDIEGTDSVDSLEIAPRYKAALKDAGLVTVAQLKAHADLASVPGLNATIAKKLKALIG